MQESIFIAPALASLFTKTSVNQRGLGMRKSMLLAGTAVAQLTVSSAGFAADLPTTAAAALPQPALMHNWTGFYIGVNIGAWAGGTLTDNATGASITGNHSAFIGGGTVGYNWQFPTNWVVGLEGTFDGTSTSNSNTTLNGTFLGLPISIQSRMNAEWIATAAARIGYAQGNWLFYGKGGAGWLDNSATLIGAAFSNKVGGVGGTFNAGNNNAGWLAGAGIEYGLTQHWSVKAEYDYLGLPAWSGFTGFAPGDFISGSRNISMFTVGVNYRFF
jgi:outer membrane immunogenic protein